MSSFTRRQYLTLKVLELGPHGRLPDIFVVLEAVASVALEHPEWDMDEERLWGEWEALDG